MRRRLVSGRRWWMAALAFAGVVVTHALSYGIAEHDAVRRAALLHETGHGIWPQTLVAAAALAALVAALAGAVTSPAAAAPSGNAVAATTTRLAALQGAGWLAVELIERAVTGHADVSMHALAPVAIGLAVQVAVATLAATLLVLLSAAAAAWRAVRAGRRTAWPQRTRPRWRPAADHIRAPQLLAGAWSSRGPPLP